MWEGEISEKAYKKLFIWFGEPDDLIGVYRKCPRCGRFLKRGEVYINGVGETSFEGWICKLHGEVPPYYDRE